MYSDGTSLKPFGNILDIKSRCPSQESILYETAKFLVQKFLSTFMVSFRPKKMLQLETFTIFYSV